MNAIVEFSRLRLEQPGPDASPAAVAGWYQMKGRLHEDIAAQGGPDVRAEQAYAMAAYEHARRILQDAGLPAVVA
jgi:hypothetical protein